MPCGFLKHCNFDQEFGLNNTEYGFDIMEGGTDTGRIKCHSQHFVIVIHLTLLLLTAEGGRTYYQCQNAIHTNIDTP